MRIVLRVAALNSMRADDRRQIQLFANQVADKMRNMPRGHEIRDRRRQQQDIINLPGAKLLRHAQGESYPETLYQHKITDYSDRLLASRSTGLGQECLDQKREVIAAPVQGWHEAARHLQAVEEVLAKVTTLQPIAKTAVGG